MTGRVEGVAETLRELGKVDKALRREVGKTIRRPAEQMRDHARARLPADPLSGWKYGRYAYDQGKAAAGIQIKLGSGGGFRGGGGTVEFFGKSSSFPLLAMIQRDAGGAVYEVAGRRSAGKGSGVSFIAGLNRHASASRAMWKAAESDLPAVEAAVMEAIERVGVEISARLRAE